MRRWLLLITATGLLVLGLLLSLGMGAAGLSLPEVWAGLMGTDPTARLIVYDLRLARSLVALLVGAALATSGGLLQGVLRNPLADPHILGVSGGASAVAVLVLVGLPGVAMGLLPPLALVGGVAAGGLAYWLSWRGGVNPDRLALTGAAVGALFSALTTLVVVKSTYKLTQAMIWLAGSLWARGWGHLAVIWPWVLPALLVAWALTPRLNLLLLGDDVAKGLGLPVERSRLVFVFLAALLAAAAVAVAGPVGFVGLVAPHLARLLVGSDQRFTLPLTGLLGAGLVLFADTLGRIVLQPLELPVGVLTAVLGAPYFLYLLRQGGARRGSRSS